MIVYIYLAFLFAVLFFLFGPLLFNLIYLVLDDWRQIIDDIWPRKRR